MRIYLTHPPPTSYYYIIPGKRKANDRVMYRLRALKAKLNEQRKHLDELDKHMYVRCLFLPYGHVPGCIAS